MRIFWLFIWRNLNPFHPRMLVPSLVEIGTLVLKKKSFKFSECIFSILKLSPLWACGPSIKYPLPKDTLCQVWLKLAQWFFKFHQCIFAITSPWKRVWHFIWTNLNSFHPRMLWVRFGWNWHSGSGNEDKNVKSLQWQWRTTDKVW